MELTLQQLVASIPNPHRNKGNSLRLLFLAVVVDISFDDSSSSRTYVAIWTASGLCYRAEKCSGIPFPTLGNNCHIKDCYHRGYALDLV